MRFRCSIFFFPILIFAPAPTPPERLGPLAIRHRALQRRMVFGSGAHNATTASHTAQQAGNVQDLASKRFVFIDPEIAQNPTSVDKNLNKIHEGVPVPRPEDHMSQTPLATKPDTPTEPTRTEPCENHPVRRRRSKRWGCNPQDIKAAWNYQPPGLSVTKNGKSFGKHVWGGTKSGAGLLASTVYQVGKPVVFGLALGGWVLGRGAKGVIVVGHKGLRLVLKGTKASARYTAIGVVLTAHGVWKGTKWSVKKLGQGVILFGRGAKWTIKKTGKGLVIVAGGATYIVKGFFRYSWKALKGSGKIILFLGNGFLRGTGFVLAKTGHGIAAAGRKMQHVGHRFKFRSR